MKEAYYFSHDANAQHDPKVIKMLSKMGWEGYGLYWALVERLRNEPEYVLQTDYDCIGYALRETGDTIKQLVEDYDLFIIDGDCFYSESLHQRMLMKEERSQKARESALKRWKPNAKAKRLHSEPNAIKESKVKESKKSKEKKIKKYILDFKSKILDQYSDSYDKDDLAEFIDYWTEPNKSNTRIKYQMESTWDENRRLKRWMNNTWTKENKKKELRFKKDSMGVSFIGYCSKCSKSDFYRTVNEDSLCCKKQILPKKPNMV